MQVVSLDGMLKELGWYDPNIFMLKVCVEGWLPITNGCKQMVQPKRTGISFMKGSGQFKPKGEKMTKLFNAGYRGPTNKLVWQAVVLLRALSRNVWEVSDASEHNATCAEHQNHSRTLSQSLLHQSMKVCHTPMNN